MNPSAPFIRRPVATSLLTIGMALAGGVAFLLLPVSPLPQVDFPTIAVSASLPGASPETMASTVATPLERALGRIAGVTEITSTSSLGSTRVTLQFDLDRNIDGAARDVQAAINAARAMLPTGLPSNPSYRKMNPADAPILIIALTSDTMPLGDLYDTASTILAQKLAQMEGVGQVIVGGSSLPAVRVELNPAAMNRYGISFPTVRAVLAAANANRPKGAIEHDDLHWQVGANDTATRAADYRPLVVSYRKGAAVRLTDIAEVIDSVEDRRTGGFANGRPGIVLIVFRQPGANIIETVDRVRSVMPVLRTSISPAIDLAIPMDATRTIRASLREVERSLVLSIALVVLVVFIFLRNARATLIPGIVVPVSLVATFGVMYLLNYSLDNLSLMALTIATGFVVDDAIVLVENIIRHLDAGEAPMEAALNGAREVAFTVVSISISLIAVFLPILLMGGIIGRLFREFAVTLAVAIVISLIVSLTTTPMMCSRLLREKHATHGRFHRSTDAAFRALQAFYERTLRWALRHPLFMMIVLAATVGLNIYLYIVVPKGFFPQQDTGRIVSGIIADQSISFQAMSRKLQTFQRLVAEDPAVDSVTGFTGGSGQRNSATMFINLKPLDERRATVDEVIGRLRKKVGREPGASLFMQPVQDIRMGGRPSNAQFQYTLQGDSLPELQAWTVRLEKALKETPELLDVSSDQQVRGLQTTVMVDRDTAGRMHVTPALVDATLNMAFSQSFASTIYSQMNQYHVVMEVAPRHLQSPRSLDDVYILAGSGSAIPLSSFSDTVPSNTPLSVNHQGQFAASTISFNLPPGKALSDAVRIIDETTRRIRMPSSITGGFQGTAKAFQQSLNNQVWLILAALVSVYLVLGMLYESYIHPLTILSTLPSAGLGALLALMLAGVEFSMIALIGIILLIGIVKKNAILMIDFAIEEERVNRVTPDEAIFRACMRRFRPILMTTLAALLGAIPLAIGQGDGAELRRPLGISVVGGLVVSQLLTLYTTPIVYLYLDRLRLRFSGRQPHNRGARP